MSQIQVTQQRIDQQESEILEINKRLLSVQSDMSAFKQSYLNFRKRYQKAKLKLEEQLQVKERIASKLNGFLLVYELKRNQTYKDLSE